MAASTIPTIVLEDDGLPACWPELPSLGPSFIEIMAAHADNCPVRESRKRLEQLAEASLEESRRWREEMDRQAAEWDRSQLRMRQIWSNGFANN